MLRRVNKQLLALLFSFMPLPLQTFEARYKEMLRDYQEADSRPPAEALLAGDIMSRAQGVHRKHAHPYPIRANRGGTSRMDFGLTGKVAIVTGGSEGIGKATAASLAQEGARVVVCARTPDKLDAAIDEIKRSTGGTAIGVPADVTDPAQIQSVVDKAVESFGRLDIMVNNAGTSAAASFETVDDAAWQHDMDLKFYAAVRFSRAVVPHMREAGGGRIINVTNLGGKQPGPNSVPTSVSRAAGIALTKALSKDLAAYNILVNTVCIGLIKSGQHERRVGRMQQQDPGMTLERFYSERGQNVPIGRVGEAREAGDVICFLASERASYLTGTSINIDGGTSGAI